MNYVDHPNGVVKGRTKLVEKELATPWDYPALQRSRKRNKKNKG
jgi:ribosomal protein L2